MFRTDQISSERYVYFFFLCLSVCMYVCLSVCLSNARVYASYHRCWWTQTDIFDHLVLHERSTHSGSVLEASSLPIVLLSTLPRRFGIIFEKIRDRHERPSIGMGVLMG